MSKQPLPAATASTIGPCPTVIQVSRTPRGWSGGAMVLDKLPVPGRPTICMTVGQGPTALAIGAGGGCFYSHLSFLLFLPLFGRRHDID